MRRHGDPSLNAALADSTALSMSALMKMKNNVVYNPGHDLFIDCIEEKIIVYVDGNLCYIFCDSLNAVSYVMGKTGD